MPDPDDQLRRVSAALDGEGPMPEVLDAEGQAFLAAATRLRARVRIEEAVTPPDVTDAVLARLASEPSPRTPRLRPRTALLLRAAAVFVLAALATVLLTRPDGPLGPDAARADVGERLLAAQHRVTGMEATLHLVERGAHPRLPVRRYDGTLRYRAPEQLWLRLEERTTPPAEFPANDLELVVDGGRAWSSGLQGCPVGAQPSCLGAPRSRVTTGLAPFAPDWVAPLDLIVPTGAFLPGAALAAEEDGDTVAIDTTVARLRHTIDGLRTAGALRDVHPADAVHLVLDRHAFTIRRLTVRARDSAAREAWAASHGYGEAPGTVVLDLSVSEGSLPPVPFPDPPAPATADAGFVEGAGDIGLTPGWLPDDYVPGRHGTRPGGNDASVTVQSWSDGRGWIRLDTTSQWDGPPIFGTFGTLVRRIAVGEGVGYTDPSGTVVALHTGDLDLTVTGSLPLDVLIRVAASLPATGARIPTGWPQGQVLDALPAGALRPPGDLVARYDGDSLVVAVPGPGQTSAVLRQQPGTSLGRPSGASIVEVPVRGTLGRHDPLAGTLTWIEDGWVRELRSDGLDLAGLLVAAARLERA